jgi:hypothetical protein
MLKTGILFLLIFLFISESFCQQKEHNRSMVKAAHADAKHSRLDNAIWKKYRLKLNHTSDYFKPDTADIKNPVLLQDSVYVEAYRVEAYKRYKRQHTPWHFLAVGGSIAAGAFILLGAVVIIAYTAAES